jgi:predicted extracellular nuclease
MKKTIIILTVIFLAKSLTAQCSDLFFSEYIEGTSNNKALEIYNPTSSTIDLSDYIVYRNNSAAIIPSDSIMLSGMLNSNDVYVIGNPYAGQPISTISDVTDDITFYGGDDAISLKKISTGIIIDKIGEINGVDPGTDWTVGSGATSDYTLVRKTSVKAGNINWAVAATEWDVYPVDVLDSLGNHSMTPCGATTIKSTDISSFISVYPNPTNGLVNVDLGDNYLTIKMSVFNSVGKLISSHNMTNTSNLVINITEPNGFYFVKIETENGKIATIKITKE